jgi:hypothetical protein
MEQIENGSFFRNLFRHIVNMKNRFGFSHRA